MTNISKKIAELSPEKLELLLKLRDKKQENSQKKGITPQSRETGLFPLSFAQQRLWFIDQLIPVNPFYNIPFAFRLVGSLDILALKRSFNEIIRRHETLRTCFQTIEAKPRQLIASTLELTLATIDLQDLPQGKREDEVRKLATIEASQPFDLTQLPLLRVKLLRLAPTEHVLLLVMHHIISDGWSIGVFSHELAVLYEAFVTGKPSPLPELPIQYADFSVWQQQGLQQQVQTEQLQYWRKQLADITVLQLPTDYPRSPVQSFAGGIKILELPQNLKQALVQLSQQHDVTLFMTLLAAFKVLLHRYTGQTDIVVGSPIANRNHSQIEGLIGFFVNSLVMRTDLDGNPSFSDLLTRVRKIALDAYAHQDLPFEKLVEELQPERHLSQNPLFQVTFAVQNVPAQELQLKGLQLSRVEFEYNMTRLDLEWHILEHSQGLQIMVAYSTDLFAPETIDRMTGHFQTLLEGIVANTQQQISQLLLLTTVEQRQLLVNWNDTQVDFPQDKCIHQLFEEQVQRTPDAVAVVYENQQLTYYQLNCRANQLAHYLKSVGVKADVLVGICVERSLEMVVGLIGILKTGGAYVPVDPDYPQDRLSFILEDTQVSVLLTQQRLVERLPESGVQLVCLDTDWQIISQSSQDNPITAVQASNLAYVIYTSGSTGQPKGVMLSHHSLCNHMFWMQATFPLTQTDKVLQKTPFSFDASVWEFYAPLLVGGQLLVAKPGGHQDTTYLLKLISEEKVTTVQFVPSLLQMLLEQGGIETCHFLKQVFCGGEALPVALQEGLFSKLNVNLHNLYGPTEACIDVTFWTCKQGINRQLVPIGRAIANTQIYILDQYLQPVPIGVPGELHIGGAGLARGYLNRPELTQEKFIPNPFSTDPDSRLYKTGDLARYLSDGNIEYLGRIDHQVKVRGFRIELGEIEALLNQNGDVQASCVIAREDTPGEKRLVAYVVPHQHCTPPISELRHSLKEKLPEYMVPNAFVMLESLPLTPNGKVDRRALRPPDIDSELKNKYIAPRTPFEEILVQIWGQVLKVEQVGIHDNFFELGGHSLLATQLVSRIGNIFKVELPLRELFATATVAELARSIQQLQQQNLELTSVPILPRARDAELPLSFAQNRLWFLDQFESNSALYNIPLAFCLVGTLNVAALEQSLQEIIHRHEALRTNLITVDGKPSQIIQTQTNWTLSIVDLKHLSTTEQEIASKLLAQQQAIQPFGLATEALVRATLVVLNNTEHVLLVSMHHVVSDGWSMSVFVQELSALYNAYSQGQPSPLAPLPIQYADFAIWQRHWLQGDVLQSQLSYWQQQLADAPALLSLPTDRPRPSVQTFTGAYQEFALSVELTNGLTQLSQQQGATLFMTLLAAFDTLLYRYTGQSDILVGSPIANRNRSEIEGLIGFFVNTLVLRTDLSGNPSFSELLTRIREMAMDAYSHQDLPFEMLVETLQPQRYLSHTPLFQVMFVLQNAPISTIELTGLTVSLLPTESATAKFDLSLAMQNTATGLVGVWEYNTDLFDAGTIERMTGHFVTLLEGIVANPQQPISQLPLLTEFEQQQLLVEWNDTQVDYPQDQCIHQLFEKQVERTPDAVAVVFENQQLTYYELNCRANQLAHYLKSLGVKADVLVGICVERSLEMVVGLLGILKADGAYVPLDPEYPSERLRFMLEDAQVQVLLTQQRLLDKLPELQANFVCLDTDAQVISQSSQENLITATKASNLAYVIYTSGSTGQPKGVLVAHHGLLNLVFWHQRAFEITSLDKATQLAGTAFDAAVWELWPYLTAGASIYLVKPEILVSPVDLQDWLKSKKVTISFLPTPVAEQLLSLEWTETTALRTILTGGDKLHRYPSRLVPFQIVNNYGPTENTVVTTSGIVVSYGQDNNISPPIGRPIANTQIYILDKYLRPVPIGVPGELHIGGAGLARGYLNRPELTQEKFIPNPFSTDPDSRLYKTGDLARYLSDGSIEYLVRIDHQVKVRGFRIELGEIEALLSQHPQIHSAVVTARVDTVGDQRLVAYIVPQHQATPTTSELRHFLKQKLPEYMLPNAFVILDSLPLTPNGKVDRRALPAPDLEVNRLVSFVPPRDTTELQLTQIWSEVLEVDCMGLQDNFFEVGGHSLLAVRLMAKIQQQFGKNLPLATLFQAPTIEQLAAILRQDLDFSDSSVSSSLVAIQPGGSKQPFFCVPGANGNVIYLYDLARYLGPDQPFYGLQAPGLDDGKFYTRIEDIALHYIEEIQAVQPQGPYLLGGHSFGGKVAFEMAIQLQKQGHEVGLLAIFDTKAPIVGSSKLVTDDWDDAQWLTQFSKAAELLFKKNLKVSYADLQPLDLDEQFKYLLEQFEMAKALPLGTDIRQFRNWVQVFKANCQIDYVSEEVYPNRITLFRASEMITDETTSEMTFDIVEDLAWGWDKLSAQPVDIHFVPGNHITMVDKPHVQVLAELLTKTATVNGWLSSGT